MFKTKVANQIQKSNWKICFLIMKFFLTLQIYLKIDDITLNQLQ